LDGASLMLLIARRDAACQGVDRELDELELVRRYKPEDLGSVALGPRAEF